MNSILIEESSEQLEYRLNILAGIRNVKEFTIKMSNETRGMSVVLLDEFSNEFEEITGNDIDDLTWNTINRIDQVIDNDIPDHVPTAKLTRTAQLMIRLAS